MGPAPLALALCLQSSRMSWAEARDPHVYRPISIAVLMRFLQQLTGITPVLVYLQPVFSSTAVLLVRATALQPAWRARGRGQRGLATVSAPGACSQSSLRTQSTCSTVKRIGSQRKPV